MWLKNKKLGENSFFYNYFCNTIRLLKNRIQIINKVLELLYTQYSEHVLSWNVYLVSFTSSTARINGIEVCISKSKWTENQFHYIGYVEVSSLRDWRSIEGLKQLLKYTALGSQERFCQSHIPLTLSLSPSL